MAKVAAPHYTQNNINGKHLPSPQSSDVVDDGRSGLNLDLLKTSYEARLNTYRNRWRVDFLSPQTLASAGFYYTGYSDIVCCPHCNVEVGKWEVGDVPLDDHKKWSPSCRFHREMQPQSDQSSGTASTSRDISSNVSETSESSSIEAGQDTCGKYGIVHSRTSNPENSSVVAGSSIGSAGVTGIHEAKASYKHYALIDRRLETFAEWPVSITQKPRDLAEAGFFYTGKSDQTVCFYCGGGLKDWESNDQPWQQHAKWFPKCNFVLLQKGVEYIAEQQQKSKEAAAAAGASSVLSGEALQPTVAAVVKEVEKNPVVSTPDNLLCKICFNKEMGVVFLPCGHMVACVDCAPVLTKCAVCRKAVDAYVRAFLS